MEQEQEGPRAQTMWGRWTQVCSTVESLHPQFQASSCSWVQGRFGIPDESHQEHRQRGMACSLPTALTLQEGKLTHMVIGWHSGAWGTALILPLFPRGFLPRLGATPLSDTEGRHLLVLPSPQTQLQ